MRHRLGVTQGAVALTKIDRVDAARLAQVREEVGAWLASTIFAGAPIFVPMRRWSAMRV
jgi:selenocysteine-specific elongation factor